MTDDCCFGENYLAGDDDDIETIPATPNCDQRDRESIARLEIIADRLAIYAMAVTGVIIYRKLSLLDIIEELHAAQDALEDLARYSAERTAASAFPEKRQDPCE